VSFTVGTLAAIHDKLKGGEKADVVILPVPTMQALGQAGIVRPGSAMTLARVGIGVVVRAGAPLPDISTADGLRKTLLAARSIAQPDPVGGGFTGARITAMMSELGIAEAVKPKISLAYAISGGVSQVASGQAEIGLFNISEILPVGGVTLVGPLPAQFQSYITFAGAIHTASGAPDAAQDLLRWLSDPSSRDAWKAGGFELLGGGT
jgi:molybdate transport system substrate-binding protein